MCVIKLIIEHVDFYFCMKAKFVLCSASVTRPMSVPAEVQLGPFLGQGFRFAARHGYSLDTTHYRGTKHTLFIRSMVINMN